MKANCTNKWQKCAALPASEDDCKVVPWYSGPNELNAMQVDSAQPVASTSAPEALSKPHSKKRKLEVSKPVSNLCNPNLTVHPSPPVPAKDLVDSVNQPGLPVTQAQETSPMVTVENREPANQKWKVRSDVLQGIRTGTY